MSRPVLIRRARSLVGLGTGEEIRAAMRKLRSDGYRGPDWDAFRGALLLGGRLQVMALGIQGLRERALKLDVPWQWLTGVQWLIDVSADPDDLPEIADMACKRQIAHFEKNLREGSSRAWRPDAGTTPLTFFVNGIAHDLPNLVRAYQRRYRHEMRGEPADDLDDQPCRALGPDEFQRVEDRVEIERLLKSAKPSTARAFWLSAAGYNDTEIAELLGMTVDEVRHDRYAFRQKIRRERGTE